MSLFPRAVPLPMHTVVWLIREVVTRVFRKSGSSTSAGGRPFLIITSLQHSTNSEWVGVLVNTVCPLSRHQHYLLERDPQECFHNLQPTTGSVLTIHPLLDAKSFCHSPCGCGFLAELPRNGSDEDHVMVVAGPHLITMS